MNGKMLNTLAKKVSAGVAGVILILGALYPFFNRWLDYEETMATAQHEKVEIVRDKPDYIRHQDFSPYVEQKIGAAK